jgi:DNA-binding transcriptional LysR family regulator
VVFRLSASGPLEGTPIIRGSDRVLADREMALRLLSGIDRIRFVVRTDSHPAQLAEARTGLGIAVVQRPIGLPDPRLQPVLPELPVPRLDTWIVTHEDLRELPRVRALFDHLAEAFRSYQAIGGRCGAPANASPDWKEVR